MNTTRRSFMGAVLGVLASVYVPRINDDAFDADDDCGTWVIGDTEYKVFAWTAEVTHWEGTRDGE
jgi:hypothetical protein